MKLAQIQLTLSPRARKIASYSGYPIFYLVCLFLFSYWTFPYGKLKDRLIAEYEASRAAAGSIERLEIGSLGPYWFTGVRARDVRLTSFPSGTDPSAKPTQLEAAEVHARVSALPLLIGRVTVGFGAKAFGGSISGSMQSGTDRTLELSLESVDVGSVGPLTALLGAPLAGTLAGTTKLVLPENKLAKANGNIDWKIDELAVGDGKTPIQGKIALPRLSVGTLQLTIEAKDGALRVTKLAAAGQDLDLVGEGKFTLQDPWANSTADMHLRFRFSDAYKGRSDMTKSLFGSPGSTAPALFELADPRIKTSKRPDGFYGWRMSGYLRDPRFDPAPTAGPGAPAGGLGGPRMIPGRPAVPAPPSPPPPGVGPPPPTP